MKIIIEKLSNAIFFRFLLVGLILNASVSKSAQTEMESYLTRPDILKIPAQHHHINNNWAKLKAAQFSFATELLSLYSPDTQIYFLARDSEYIYDVARLITENTKDADRIHLLNVSRSNMRDKNIVAYLNANGISEANLQAGKKILLVDTGFAGTIPRVIESNFSHEAGKNLKTHLIVSIHPEFPSSRNFLIHLNPSANEQNSEEMHGSIIIYENLPRYTDCSVGFTFSDGQWQPLSKIGGSASDGRVSKEESYFIMQDLKAEWQNPAVKETYLNEKIQIEKLVKLLTDNTAAATELIKTELDKTRGTYNGLFMEAQLRDIMDSKKNAGLAIEITNEDLGLSENRNSFSYPNSESKKHSLSKTHPDWTPILANPEEMIRKIFKDNNWQMIRNLIDADVDHDINEFIAESLFKAPAEGIKKDLQIYYIEKVDTVALGAVAFALANPETKDMTDIFKLVIDKADSRTMKLLAQFTFAKPHTKDMIDLLKRLIDKTDSETLEKLARYTFSQPHTKDMKHLIKLVINKADADTLRFLAGYTFSQPHTKDMTDLLKLLIEKADAFTLQDLAEYTFSQPHTKSPEHQIMKSVLNIFDPVQRKKTLDSKLIKINSPLVIKKTPFTAEIQVQGQTYQCENIFSF